MNHALTMLKPSQRVRVVQAIRTPTGVWRTQVEGIVVQSDRRPTGSWYAPGAAGRLWLQRLRLRKDDGEIVDLIMDPASSVTILPPAARAG